MDELKQGVRRLVDVIEQLEPPLIGYGFYFDDAANQMTVTSVQQDSASLELHMEVGRGEFRKLSGMLTRTAIEVCGSIRSHARTIRHPSGGSDATSERRRVRRDDHHAANRRIRSAADVSSVGWR